jgi:hypothetical protein
MAGGFFKSVINTLGEEFGTLDNAAEKWAHQQEELSSYFPEIREHLEEHFPDGSTPLRIFEQGSSTYTRLLGELAAADQPPETIELAAATLNLRFYILLNAFLAACQESLEKAALNDSLDAAALVEKSYYTPFFFRRATLSTKEAAAMLEEDIAKLESLPRETKGILAATRIQKGIVATLAETYCPTHPLLYSPVQELDAIRASSTPAVIDEISSRLNDILMALTNKEH